MSNDRVKLPSGSWYETDRFGGPCIVGEHGAVCLDETGGICSDGAPPEVMRAFLDEFERRSKLPKPCWWCGYATEIRELTTVVGFRVECTSCGAQSPGRRVKSEAIATHNKGPEGR